MPLDAGGPSLQDPNAKGARPHVVDGAGRSSWLRTAAVLALGAVAAFATLFIVQTFHAGSTKSRLETACASILNVVNPQGSTFERNGSSLSINDQVVRMLYSVTNPEGQGKRIVILCAFEGGSMSVSLPKLAAVSLNGHQLGPARLAFLNRFWLRSEEATAALPSGEPTTPAQTHMVRPPGAKHALQTFHTRGLDCAGRRCVS